MIVFSDILSGDEMFTDSLGMKEVEDGFFYEVEGQWIEVAEGDVDIGANPSAEEADEGVENTSRRVVNVIDSARLQEQPSYDKKGFMGYIKPWLAKVVEKLPADQKDEFKAKAQPAIKFLIGKLKELQFFLGESMDQEGTLAYAYYKEGASNPTFLFCKYAMKETKV